MLFISFCCKSTFMYVRRVIYCIVTRCNVALLSFIVKQGDFSFHFCLSKHLLHIPSNLILFTGLYNMFSYPSEASIKFHIFLVTFDFFCCLTIHFHFFPATNIVYIISCSTVQLYVANRLRNVTLQYYINNQHI